MDWKNIKIPKKTYLIGGGVLAGGILLGLGVKWYLNNRKTKDLSKKKGETKKVTKKISFCKKELGDKFPLQKGSCGENVRKWQEELVKSGVDIGNHGKNKDGVDGVYWTDTAKGTVKTLGRNKVEKQDLIDLTNA